MTETFELPLEDARPTQLYLSAAKLAAVLEQFEGEKGGSGDGPGYGPLPAFERDGEWFLSDGHTRAFAAYLGGAESLEFERDPDVREAYDFELYLTCIEWCREAGVHSVPDLAGRVLAHEEYEREWIVRCQRATDEDR